MSLRKYRKQYRSPMLDLTGASDIIFTLLLFYILSQNFLPALEVELPGLNQQNQTQNQQEQFIVIKNNGAIEFSDKSVSILAIKRDPNLFLSCFDLEKPITIKADRNSAAENVIGLMEVFSNSGVRSVNFLGLPDADSK